MQIFQQKGGKEYIKESMGPGRQDADSWGWSESVSIQILIGVWYDLNT